MERLLLGVFLAVLSLAIIYALRIVLTGLFVGFGEPASEFEWWNISWRYRFRIEVNSTLYETVDWPIEQFVNFTDLLPSGTFDENSIRVFEYSTSGSILHEVPSQFEKEESFDASSNAAGTLVFLMNGSTQANAKRIYFVYYDTVENGVKEAPNYPTDIQYSWDGQTININNTLLKIYIDTNRGENTSGIYHVEDLSGTVAITASSSDRTAEYLQYSNGTHDLTFDLRNNASFFLGPVRLTIKQIGDEVVFGQPGEKTGESRVIKKYNIYYKAGPQEYGTFIKISQEIKNTVNQNIERASTPAGALAFDLERTLSSGHIYTLDSNSSDPYSWVWGSGYGGEMVGLINLLEEGTSNFYSTNSTSYGRIGIQLETETIPSESSIKQVSLVYFATWGGSDAVSEFLSIKNRILNPLNITQYLPEARYVVISPSTNATVYNRNESVLVIGNVSSGDPYNLVRYMNATFDMGTLLPDDDQTIILYDDGTHGDEVANDKTFTNIFEIANDAALGIWKINFTTYSENFEFLNSTTFEFNVTDILNVSVNVLNKRPMIGGIVTANIYVKNYRQDSWISGVMINCSYNSFEVMNKTDHNNGTYSVNFTAPSTEGIYTLVCNATRNGNFGNASDDFTAEPRETYINIIPQPQNPIIYNVSLYEKDSFVIIANASNFGNGTAYSTNITLEILEDWSANTTEEKCGDLSKGEFCIKSFNVTVPNGTVPGDYYINITAKWINPDNSISTNKTQVNVSVRSNPKMNVEEVKVSGEIGDGTWSLVGNFTVLSIGNDALQNIQFSCFSGTVCQDFTVEFIPASIQSLPMGEKGNVSINASVPLAYQPGVYTGTINVSAENDGFDTFVLEILIPAKTNVSIITNISSYVANKVTQENNETFHFRANATNTRNGSARFVNISVSVPSGWLASPSIQDCGTLIKNQTCSKEFSITIPKAILPGNYLVNISTNWTHPDGSMGTNRTSIIVTVGSNPLINVSETIVSGIVLDGTEASIGNFTVLSIGNDALQNIQFSCFSGTVCQDFTVEFIPASIQSLPVNSNQSVMINITVPLSYPNGTYSGIINVSSQNNGFDILTIEVSVPINRTWDLYPEYCERSTQQPEGTACEINVTNKGNAKISFVVLPEEGNYTKVNETSFEIERLSWHVFKITYNVTDVEPGIYNSTFLVDAVEEDAKPDNKSVRVSLMPYIPPIINVSIVPNETEQNSSVTIFANVTDKSGSGIAWAKVNITRPNGIVDTFNLLLLEADGNLTRWELVYPDANGSTLLRGIYNVTVYARDNIGNEDSLNSTFLIYTKLKILLSTQSDKYYQGDTGSIYYVSKDLTDSPIQNVSVYFMLINSQGNITYLSPNLQTNSEGTITPMPSFSLPSDASLGNYTLISYSTYEDKAAKKIIERQDNYTFLVASRTVTVTGLFADIETSVVWYPENIMKFGILVYNGEGKPVDPSSMNLSVHDPANNLYFIASLPQMTKRATGFYTYQYAMPANTPSGMFLAVLNVSQGEFQTMKLKAFRVARGGPYDVRIVLLENEVEQGSYLDFILIIENKGEVSQDVFVDYWISSQNTTYFTSSEAVYTPAVTNQSFTRNAYIYSNQPLGNYWLNVRVTYDSVQPPILANASFVVVARALNITPQPPVYVEYPYLITGAVPVPVPTEKLIASIFISRYNSNISLARGFSRIESVIVENNGQVDLENVSLFLLGIPTNWFTITPESYKILAKGASLPFIITFNIPKNVNPGEYYATLIATSGVVSDQRKITLTIFESIKELLAQEISKLEEELQELIIDTKVAEREGKDVSAVLLIIENIKTQIKLAKENIEEEKMEEALKNINTAKDLILRAREELSKLEVVKVKAVIPLWMIILILIPLVIFGLYLVYRRKPTYVRPWIITLEKVLNAVKKRRESKEELIREREKLFRMLDVLEKERREGMITIGAYKEMKKGIEKKIAEIEKKIVSLK